MEGSVSLWRVTFDTNPDDCNLTCIMCEDHSPYSKTKENRIINKLPRRRMSIDFIEKIFLQAKELGVKEIIPSTMGEPLIYPYFDKILEFCKRQQIMLNLTTNGTFPKKGARVWAEQLVPLTTDVKVSWNGATKRTQESIMLGTKWEQVLENVREFIVVRDAHAKSGGNYCNITLQLTFMKSNIEELHDVVKLGIELGVNRIKGHHLWTHSFPELETQSLRNDVESIKRWNITVDKCKAVAESYHLATSEKIKLVNFDYLDENAMFDLIPDGKCPFLGREAWVATDGRFNPCCAPDKERRALGDFGNLNEITLKEVLESQAYKNLCENYMENKVCRKCNMRQKVLQAVSQQSKERILA